MKQKIKSVVLALATVGIIAASLVPLQALAADNFKYADLKKAAEQTTALCKSRGQGSEYCDRAKMYAAFLATARKKPSEAAREKYVAGLPDQWTVSIYASTTKAYAADVQAGKIDSGAEGTSNVNLDPDKNCPDGSVEVSISPSSNGDNCIGGKNPIYTYLKAIILFMGGAIGLAVVITIIVAGIQYSSSAGNAANITKAKERLINAVIGLVLYLFLAAILRYIVPQIFT